MQFYHNSSQAKYKSRLGALTTSDYTKITVLTGAAFAVKIKLEYEQSCCIYQMQQLDTLRTTTEWSYELVTPPEACVLFYSFIVEVDGQTFYFGCDNQSGQGNSALYEKDPPRFQITVYERDFKTPDWAKKSVMYQIFPDRFCRGNENNLVKGRVYHEALGRKIVTHNEWEEQPLYTPVDGRKDYFPCDFFGGDLIGIEKNLDYLQKLSVNVIYLNPICEASSNHRYDTADYMCVDPILGSNYDFSHLCDAAASRGIKIILDGVFSHTGSDSVYFNKQQSYKSFGAYQGEQSEFYPWYKFDSSPVGYKSWWGFETLPEVDEENPDWQRYIITSKNGVLHNWMNMGACGWRLDVADELPDEVIAMIRSSIKKKDSNSFLLGEVWEDATTKQSYGTNRRYALGGGLDSVMNYPFRGNCLNFLQNKINGYELVAFLCGQALNYPPEMYYCLMNLISSHDVPRAKTLLATGINGENMTRSEQAALAITDNQSIKGKTLLKLAAALQFAVPGMPSIYYGDEQGLDGLKDPFNRGTFSHNDDELADFFATLANLRKTLVELNTGDVSFLALSESVVCILRFVVSNKDRFGVHSQNGASLIIINTASSSFCGTLSLNSFESCINSDRLIDFRHCSFTCAKDALTNEEISLNDMQLKFDVEGEYFKIISIK